MIKRLLTLTITLFATAIIVGCGGNSTNSEPASDAKTVVQVNNSSPFDFAGMTIQSANGVIYYNGEFNCSRGRTNCYLNINEDINEPVTILFKDTNGRLVRAVALANQPGVYLSLNPSSMDTGLYLMKRLASELLISNNLSWSNVNDRVQTFFTNYDSPDGTLDPFEEIGDYYTSQLLNGVASETVFLSTLKQRLLQWDVARSDELPNVGTKSANLSQRFFAFFNLQRITLVSTAYAQSQGCGEGLKTFLNFAENLGSIVPIVGDAVAGAAGIGNSYCDDTDAKLDQIINQLNILQESVELVNRNVSVLSSFLADAGANQKTTEFEKLAKTIEDLNKQYKRFLSDNQVKSLQEYFVKKGGWNGALSAGGGGLDNLLGAAYKNRNSNNLFPSILDTTNNADFLTYLRALQTRCAGQTRSSTENFVVVRQQCNNIILANSGRLIAAQGLLLPIVKDVYAVLNTYKEEAQKTYLLPSEIQSYATAYSDIRSAFNNQQAKMINNHKSIIGGIGFFNAFDGLDSQLVSSLVTRQCSQSGKDRTNSPAITGWFAPSTQSSDSYIVTNCQIGNKSQRITARYFYNDQGSINANDVANVLGVPVAYHYVRTGSPLYNSNANISSENITSWGGFLIEAPSLIDIGVGNTSVINAGDRYVVKRSSGLWEATLSDSKFWILIPSRAVDQYNKPLYHLVATVELDTIARERADWFTTARLTCVTSPCRVDPGTGQWLIFYDQKSEQQSLDLRETTKPDPSSPSSGKKILRLAPVNE